MGNLDLISAKCSVQGPSRMSRRPARSSRTPCREPCQWHVQSDQTLDTLYSHMRNGLRGRQTVQQTVAVHGPSHVANIPLRAFNLLYSADCSAGCRGEVPASPLEDLSGRLPHKVVPSRRQFPRDGEVCHVCWGELAACFCLSVNSVSLSRGAAAGPRNGEGCHCEETCKTSGLAEARLELDKCAAAAAKCPSSQPIPPATPTGF